MVHRLRERGDHCFHRGDYDLAVKYYRRALRLSPDDPELYYMLAEVCGRKGWRITMARTFYFDAFRRDPDRTRRLQWKLARREFRRPGTDAPRSIFVLGCAHSGTTILARLLASHRALMHAYQGESNVFLDSGSHVRDTLDRWDSECLAGRKSGWVEKSVSHCFQIPRILAHRPDARFVIIVRDGRDVTCSMKTRKYAYRSFAELVGYWLIINRTILHYANTRRFHVAHYEGLVNDPESVLQGICAFIGEDFDEAMLDYHRRQISWNEVHEAKKLTRLVDHDDHQRLRHWQINQPLFDGRGRWRRGLTDEEKSVFRSLAGRALHDWGFVRDDQW